MATKKQIGMIYAITKRLGWTDEERKEYLKKFGVEQAEEIGKKEASEAITELEKLENSALAGMERSGIAVEKTEANRIRYIAIKKRYYFGL